MRRDPGTPCMRSIGTGYEREYHRPTTHRYHYHCRNYRDHGGCYKSHRRGRAVARQDTVAVSLISLKEKPNVEIHATPRRETLISYVATRKIDTIHACVLVLYLFFSQTILIEENKIPDREASFIVLLSYSCSTLNADTFELHFFNGAIND